jgi:hypothetical protein
MLRSTSARCYIEYAKLEPDNAKATQALLRAAGINPKLDEPFALLAARDTDPAKRTAHWKAAAERNPRNPAYWKALADCYLADHNYAERRQSVEREANRPPPIRPSASACTRRASRSSTSALDYEEPPRGSASRRGRPRPRSAQAAGARQRARARSQIQRRLRPGRRRSPFRGGTAPLPSGKIRGMLTQVDCLGAQARLVVAKETITRPSNCWSPIPPRWRSWAPVGKALGCGPADAALRCPSNTSPNPTPGWGTAGEVATIEFQ